MNLNFKEYKNKVLGCWMGKNIGGTLGAPDEWARQTNSISFYTQELDGNPLPNDDLDIQLLWLIAMEEQGLDINAAILSEYWNMYVTPHWAEYGAAKINIKNGLVPPVCGSLNNPYKDSCGSFIRSEIWACLAPGFPEIAVRYAYEDAIIDHGNGEGFYAEIFCAAMESAAFIESDIRTLINIGLSYIPTDCAIAKAIGCAIECYDLGKSWQQAREELLRGFRGRFFASWKSISKEDLEKGYADGPPGFDAPSNIGIVVAGLLYGEGDFAKSLCTAVNFGEDTDCTAATIGSIFGIINGIDKIPEEWIRPIGRSIKTLCLNLGDLEDRTSVLPARWKLGPSRLAPSENGGVRKVVPQDIDELSARVIRLARQAALKYNTSLTLTEESTDVNEGDRQALYAAGRIKTMFEYKNSTIHSFPFFEVSVHYGEDHFIKPGEPKRLKVRVENTYRAPAALHLKWYCAEGVAVTPSQGGIYLPHAWMQDHSEIEFEIFTETPCKEQRLVLEITAAGRNTNMLVPVLLHHAVG